MPFTKDLVIATSLLVGCCVVLFLTYAEPSSRREAAEPGGGTDVARASAPELPPGSRLPFR